MHRARSYWEAADDFLAKKKANPDATLVEPKKPGIARAVFSALGWWFWAGGLLTLIGYSSIFPSTFMVRALLDALQSGRPLSEIPHVVVIFCIGPLFLAFFEAWALRMLYHSANRLRNVLTAMVFRKSFRMNTAQGTDSGQMLSLMSVDAKTASEYIIWLHYGWVSTINIIAAAALIYTQVEYALFPGIGVIVLVVPASAMISIALFSAMNRFLAGNDDRTKLTSETIMGIRVVKYGALEETFAKRIRESRNRQCKSLYQTMLCSSIIGMFFRALPIIINVAVFLTFAAIWPARMSPNAIFTALSFLTILTQEMTHLPMMFSSFAQVIAALGRIKEFLLMPELDPNAVKRSMPDGSPIPPEEHVAIRQGSFRWPIMPKLPPTPEAQQAMAGELAKAKKAHQKALKEASKKGAPEPPAPAEIVTMEEMLRPASLVDLVADPNTPPTLADLEFAVPRGSLTMIVGNVGSGKSSVLSAMLGDVQLISGSVQVGGTVAYCAQQAWIANDTVRGNILFNQPFDEARYREAIRTCALEDDIAVLSAGDQTEIGERGVNLSGGQKQRVSLARAVYSNRDVYLLDDPLSAVDAHVGRHIFEQCISGMLAGTTRILVTNALQYLEHADQVIVMKDGRITAKGHYSELRKQGIDFSEFVVRRQDMEAAADATATTTRSPETRRIAPVIAPTPTGSEPTCEVESGPTAEELAAKRKMEEERARNLITEEEQMTGGVGLKTYVRYLGTYGSVLVWIVLGIFFALQEGSSAMSNWWLSQWTGNKFPALTINHYMLIYGGIAVFMVLVNIVRVVLWNKFAIRSSRKLHHQLLDNVLAAPSSFFESTPTGRILNRFSGDVNQVDLGVPMQFEQVIEMWLRMIGALAIIAVAKPIVLVFFVPIVILFFIMQNVYRRTSRELQRIEGITRSPVYSQFSEVLTGVTTIRAYEQNDAWIRRHTESCNTFSSAWIMYRLGEKWMSLYQSIISVLLLTATLLVLYFGRVDTALSGLALTNALTINTYLTYLVQLNVELESRMTSAERVFEYTLQIPQERKTGTAAPPSWPEEGSISFENVQLRYHAQLPLVLRGVDFHIRPHEKIGVVGRTAAGKSSLIVALFRLRELDEGGCSGTIRIDNRNITQMRLSDVRSKIAIIPQDPVLFSGTVRYNLDLTERRDDATIWRALDMVELKSAIEALPGGLDAAVAENGSNFSVGQRQLICLARALIEERRIVVMDEATASVDPETDAKIQRTVREQLRECTVFVVAHRINTIIDYDRILVMQQGRVAEVGTPAELRSNPDSVFNQLLRSLEEVAAVS